MRPMLALFAVVLILLAGCEKEPPPPPEPAPPPEPTADEIYQQMRQSVQVIRRPIDGGEALSMQEAQMAVDNLGQTKQKYAMAIHAPEAIGRLKRDLEEWLRLAEKDGRWRPVKAVCMAWKKLEPTSTRFDRKEERADVMLARPNVALRGFTEIDGDLFMFFEVTDPDSGRIENYQQRVGDVFHNDLIRVVEVIGGQDAVRLEYTPVNDTDWVVKAPSVKRRAPKPGP